MQTILVGNLCGEVLEGSVRALFQPHGSVGRVNIVSNPETGQTRGFGFVEMANEGECRTAIGAVNGMELGGRTLHVSRASSKPEDPWAEVKILDGFVQSVCGSKMRVVVRGYNDALRLMLRDGLWFAEDGLRAHITFFLPFSNDGPSAVTISLASNGHSSHLGLVDAGIPNQNPQQCSDCHKSPAHCRLCLGVVVAGNALSEHCITRSV